MKHRNCFGVWIAEVYARAHYCAALGTNRRKSEVAWNFAFQKLCGLLAQVP
jgi:hypothetical protein